MGHGRASQGRPPRALQPTTCLIADPTSSTRTTLITATNDTSHHAPDFHPSNGNGVSTHAFSLTSATTRSARHTTHYWHAGPADGPLIFFLHGWPGIALLWRAQIEAFAAAGWRCVAPDMRGYGESSAPAAPEAYALAELVTDMAELHDHLGAQPAIWVGHDLGSPVAGALAAHHPDRAAGLVLIAVPYLPESFALPTLLPLINRNTYPEDQYPDGQWDYYRFYLTHFAQSVHDFEADVAATLATIYQPGNPTPTEEPSPSATVTRNGGWFGPSHRAPNVSPAPLLWPATDFEALTQAFRRNGFRPANAWYLNDTANVSYARTVPNAGQLELPVLFINGDRDPICDINRSDLGRPMKHACRRLTVANLSAGHWSPLELKSEVIEAIRTWLSQFHQLNPPPNRTPPSWESWRG